MMNRIARSVVVVAALSLALVPGCSPSQPCVVSSPGHPAEKWSVEARQKMADHVKSKALLAWGSYKSYAWGHDEIRPLTKTSRDWYKRTLLMTPVDALDTLILMGATAQANEARELIATKLDLDLDDDVKAFEINIRLMGGLLSSYELTGDRRLLDLAHDLGNRLLPVFNSPTGLPYVYVNLHTGKTRGTDTNPAEIGTYLIEFGTLSKLTGDPKYYNKAKAALVALYDRRSKIGLVGQAIDSETGKWTNTDSHVGGCIDSYYEYVLKASILFGDADCRRMWETHVAAVNRYVADDRAGTLWHGVVNMNTGQQVRPGCGSLDAFWSSALALGGDVPRARRAQDAYFKMWNLCGIEPEQMNYATMKVTDPTYVLRPEIVESTFYLAQMTGDAKYYDMGASMFADLETYCGTETGFAAMKNVVTKEKDNQMESFFFAETLKYYYCIFAPNVPVDLKTVVMNTEAHPMKR